ncbi:hypothetical protein LTR15_005585 [Elasticomyces elasticus]|nr:hypothetical protein LTR15_005585 [Elasticomyces elasticus]
MPSSNSTSFAMLVPLTTASAEALRTNGNHARLKYQHCGLNSTPRRKIPIAKLDFATLSGSRCLMFGTSRACHITFSDMAGLAAQQFAVHFEMQTGTLLITDLSLHGTWITDHGSPLPRRLRHTTSPLFSKTTISFGQERRLEYTLIVAAWLSEEPQALDCRLARYAESICRVPPVIWPGAQSVIVPLKSVGRNYLILHHIASGSTGAWFTCLRVRDGRLLAIKHTSHRSRKWDISRAYINKEVSILQRMKHPNIVTLIDSGVNEVSASLITEYVALRSLRDLQHQRPADTTEQDTIKSLVRQGLFALVAIHRRGVVHNRIAASRVLVVTERPLRVKLTGFAHASTHSAGQHPGSDICDLARLALVQPESSQAGHQLPANAVDLLQTMLGSSTNKHASAAALLDHPWLQNTLARKRRRSCDNTATEHCRLKRPRHTATSQKDVDTGPHFQDDVCSVGHSRPVPISWVMRLWRHYTSAV